MVEQAFLDKINSVLEATETSRGEVALFAIVKMDDLTDKWTLLVGASWGTSESFDKLFTEIRAELVKVLASEMSTIARIGIFNLDDHFVQLLLDKFKTGDTIKDAQQVNGNLIHEGILIKAIK